MNHSRPTPPIKFCPSCGKKVGHMANVKCDSDKHAVRRKDRDQYCVDCGVTLTK